MAPAKILGWGAGGHRLSLSFGRVTARTSVWGSLSLCDRGTEPISPLQGIYFGSSLFVASHLRFSPIARYMRINANRALSLSTDQTLFFVYSPHFWLMTFPVEIRVCSILASSRKY